MSTQGKDFFKSNWFESHAVFLFDCPLDRLDWYLDIPGVLLQEWADLNNNSDIELAKCVTTDFSAKILTLPLNGYSQVRHHFEKITWLTQSYVKSGWKNSVKAVNTTDTGTFIVHPGTNRCVAANFLGCKTLPIMLTVHKDQNLYNELKDSKHEITTEQELRDSLNSSDTILFRTEIEEDLFIGGHRTDQKMIDFTYEFLGSDAWPEGDRLHNWQSVIFDNLPLNIYYTKNVDPSTINTKILGKCFYRKTDKATISITKTLVDSEDDIAIDGLYIYLDKPFNRDIFELFFLLDYNSSLCTKDNKVKLVNKGEFFIIPEHFYV